MTGLVSDPGPRLGTWLAPGARPSCSASSAAGADASATPRAGPAPLVFARVVRGGLVCAGDPIELLPPLPPAGPPGPLMRRALFALVAALQWLLWEEEDDDC